MQSHAKGPPISPDMRLMETCVRNDHINAIDAPSSLLDGVWRRIWTRERDDGRIRAGAEGVATDREDVRNFEQVKRTALLSTRAINLR